MREVRITFYYSMSPAALSAPIFLLILTYLWCQVMQYCFHRVVGKLRSDSNFQCNIHGYASCTHINYFCHRVSSFKFSSSGDQWVWLMMAFKQWMKKIYQYHCAVGKATFCRFLEQWYCKTHCHMLVEWDKLYYICPHQAVLIFIAHNVFK